MKHKFAQLIGYPDTCIFCKLSRLEHTDEAQCESCSNIGPCVLVGSILMCSECEIKHNSVVVSVKQDTPELMSPIERTVNQVNRLVETNQIADDAGNSVKSIIDNAIAGNIKEFKDFFNAKIPSIMELEKNINDDVTIVDKRYELAKVLGARVRYLGTVLFQFTAKSLEASAEVKSIQQYMNTLIPNLRMEQRSQFAENNVAYTPLSVKSNIPKVKLSTEDKLAEGYAKLMKIPLEQARMLMKNKLKSEKVECTCAVTPGICKLHKS